MQNVQEDVTSFTYNEAQYNHGSDNKVACEDRIEMLETANTLLVGAEFEAHDKVTHKLQTTQRQLNAARDRYMEKGLAYNRLEEAMQQFYNDLRAADPGADVASIVDGFESLCQQHSIPLTKTVEVKVTVELEVEVPIGADLVDLNNVDVGIDPEGITFTAWSKETLDVDDFEIADCEVGRTLWSD